MSNNYGLEGAISRTIKTVVPVFEQTQIVEEGTYGPGQIVLDLESAEKMAEFADLTTNDPNLRVSVTCDGNTVVYKFATIENIGSGFVNEDYDISTYPDEIPTYFAGGAPASETTFTWWDVEGEVTYQVTFETLLVKDEEATLSAYTVVETEESRLPNYNLTPSDYHVNNNIAANFGPGINIMDAMDKAAGLPGVQEVDVVVGPIEIPESRGGDTPDEEEEIEG